MSTEYMPSRRIAIERIRGLSHNGVSARLVNGYLLLSDGVSSMWAFPATWGRRVTFVCKGDKDVRRIIDALEDYFKMHLVPQHTDEFRESMETECRMAHSRRRHFIGPVVGLRLQDLPETEEEDE